MNRTNHLIGKFVIILCSALFLTAQTGCRHGGPPGFPRLPGLPRLHKLELRNPAGNAAGNNLERNGSPLLVQNEKAVNVATTEGEFFE